MGIKGNKNSTFSISSPPIADHQTLLMDPCFCIVICRRLSGFTLDVHEPPIALTLHAYFLKIWLMFFSFYNSILFRALLS